MHTILNLKKIIKINTSYSRANEAFESYKTNNEHPLAHIETRSNEPTKDEFSDEDNTDMAMQTLNKFNAQRKGGKGAMIVGGSVTVVAGIMAGVGGYQAKPGLAIAGGVLAGAGGLSFLVGLFCWIDGQIKYYNARNELNLIKFKKSSISTDGAKISLNF